MTYDIVLFIKENTVEAVPSHWLSRDGKTCAWPKRHLDPIRQIEKKKLPNTLEYTWFKIRILAKSISSLIEAKAKAEIATVTSDLSSIEEDKETRNIRCKKISDNYYNNDCDSLSFKKKPKNHFKTIIQDKIPSPPKFIETRGIVDDNNSSDSDTVLFSNVKSLSISKNKALVSTSAILISPSGKWDVDDIDLPNPNKIIKRKLDFGSTLLHSKSPLIDADILCHDNINLDHSSIHYTDGMDNINGNLKNDCFEKFNVEDKHLDNTSPTHFSTPSSISISNSSKIQAEMLNILKSLTRTVTNMKYDLRNITTKIDRLENVLSDLPKNQNNSSTKNNYHVDESIYNFPLTNLEELNIFEEKIKDNDFRQKMITFLVRLERTTVSDMTRQIMSKLFHNNLLSKFSYSGQKKKMIFSTLNSCALIFETIRTVKNHKDCIDQEILKPMKFYMANAKFREEKKQNKSISS